MKTFDFNRQIKIMNEIFQSNISLAETANIYLNKIRPQYLRRAIKQLKMDYQFLFLKQDGQKFNSIRSTLHLILKQKVTNIDELFIDLGEQINTYYGTKYLDLKKQIPYSKECIYCHKYVSNYQDGVQSHQQKCNQNHKSAKKTAHKNQQAKSLEKNNRVRKNKVEKLKDLQGNEQQQSTRQSKKQSLCTKIQRKHQQFQRNKIIKVQMRPKDLIHVPLQEFNNSLPFPIAKLDRYSSNKSQLKTNTSKIWSSISSIEE